MSHRAADTETDAPAPAPRSLLSRAFSERALPHWGMAAIAVLYGVFLAAVGAAAVPQPISLAFTGTVAMWFGYLIQQSRNAKGDET